MVENVSILVINPNSSTSMTRALEPLLADLNHTDLLIDYFTAPPSAPPSINDNDTSQQSTEATFPALLPILERDAGSTENATDLKYSAYLIACYSQHPLTALLRSNTPCPVLNIFEASILHARALARPFGIVTTGKYWESVLLGGVNEFLIGKAAPEDNGVRVKGFVGVRSTGLSAIELHSTPHEEVHQRVVQASAELVQKGAEVILLGCAGMSGMDESVREGARFMGKDILIVDGVRAGILLLEGIVKAQRRCTSV